MEKEYIYGVICSARLGESVPPIREIEESLNLILSKCGVDEQIFINVDFEIMSISTSRNLTKGEKDEMIKIIQKSVDKIKIIKLTVKRLSDKSSSNSNKSQ